MPVTSVCQSCARTGSAQTNAQQQEQEQELRRQVAALQERAAATNQEVTELPPPGSAFLSATLTPDLARGPGRQTTHRLASGISKVLRLLRCNHDEHSSYRAKLETAEGEQVWQEPSLECRPAQEGGAVIVVDLASSILNRGEYVLRLFQTAADANEVGTYSFRVVKP